MENLINNFETNGQNRFQILESNCRMGNRDSQISESYPVESILECLRQADKVISIEGLVNQSQKNALGEI